jgi:hypothetical protein
MLWQRVVTALVLLLVLLPALFYPSAVPFSVLAMAFIAAAAWEWARLSGYGQAVALGSAAVTVTACALVWQAGLLHATLTAWWASMALGWVLGGAWLLRGGTGLWLRLPSALKLGIGVLVLIAAWLAVAQARRRHQFPAVGAGAGVGGRHLRLFCRVAAGAGDWIAQQAGAEHQPWQELGRCLGRHGRRAGAGAASGPGLDGQLAASTPSLYSQVLGGGRWYMLAAIHGSGCDERRRRPGRVAAQARGAASRTAAICCPAMAACSTASMPCCRPCRWPCFCTPCELHGR